MAQITIYILSNIILATENVGNLKQMYIISCMNVSKQLQFIQKNEKLLLRCALVAR